MKPLGIRVTSSYYYNTLKYKCNEGGDVASKIQIKPGLLARLREVRGIPSEEHQARLMGVDRTTLRRIDGGAVPSGAFMAALADTFGLGLGEAFELVPVQTARAGLKVAS